MTLQACVRDQRGSVSVIFAMGLIVILGAAGLAIDYSRGERLKSQMQNSLDAAVLAGAVADAGREIETAQRRLQAAGLPGVTASFSVAPSGEVSGQATARLPTSLLAAMGLHSLRVTTSSSAVRNAAGRVCVLVLDPSASQALIVNNGADISAPGCEMHVRSTASPAAVFNAGTNIDSLKLCIASSNVIDNGGTHPGLELGCAAANDPYAGTLPDPASATCDYNMLNYTGGTVSLNPGVYCGGINFNAAPDVTFAPGVYVIRGGNWNVNGGTWSGNGVVFYFADTSIIQFNSAVSATLTAPASGPYEGVAMFEKAGLSRSPFVLDDSQNFEIEGLIYLPSRDTIFNAASSLTDKAFTLVVNTLILNQTAWSLEASALASAASAGGTGTSRLTR
jgi:Flp pilus assembly protein TadG